MQRFTFRFVGLIIALLTALGLGSTSANAQANAERVGSGTQKSTQPVVRLESSTTAPTAKICQDYYLRIVGNGVRIRKSPGGTILGLANYGERVEILNRSGVWVEVILYQRPAGHLYRGWVHQDYVQPYQPTCW